MQRGNDLHGALVVTGDQGFGFFFQHLSEMMLKAEVCLSQ